MGERKKIFLLDGTAFAYRSHFAMIKNPLFNSKGENVSAIFGSINSILKIIRDENPEYIAIAFDSRAPTFRHKLYDEYKSTRAKMPDELGAQLPTLKELLNTMGIPVIEKEGLEADDLVAILAKEAVEEGLEAVLVTSDKDFFQLIDENTKILDPGRGAKEPKWWDISNASEKFGVPPNKVIDFMALTGDSSDNIPGVQGVGPKTALKLFEQFNSLDEIYNNLDKVENENLRNKLAENKELAYLSKELVTIKTDVVLRMNVDDIKKKQADNDKLYPMLKELEFHSIIKQLELDQYEEAEEDNYITIKNEEAVRRLIDLLKNQQLISVDTETTSKNPTMAELVGISISYKQGESYYIPLGHKSMDMFPDEKAYHNVDMGSTLQSLKTIFENKDIKKIGHNIKYDMIVLKKYGIDLNGLEFDTMVASYLLEPNLRHHNLKYLALKYLNYNMISYSEVTKTKKGELSFAEVPVDKATVYSGEDADITLRLYTQLKPEIEKLNLTQLLNDIEIPLISVLADIETTGVKLDIEFLRNMSEDIKKRMDRLEKEIYEAAGEQFNINSSQQLREILFTKFKLPVIKRVKTGPSTDVEVLQKLKNENPIPGLILKYREYAKLQNTYVDALPILIDPETNRIHASFNQTVTSTGRLSSSDPNLQNIPIRGEYGREIRKAFIPSSEDNLLLSADYSQIELRVVAHIADDENLIKAFIEDRDIHTFTASQILDKPMESIDSNDRRIAKTVNFGIIYGISPYGLSERLDMGIHEADIFIKEYFERYPKIKEYMDKTKEQARENGYVTTLFNRRCYLPEINSSNQNQRSFAERVAINAPIQGTAADIIKIAMIDIYSELQNKNLKSKMIIQVHDELLFDVPEDELETLKTLVKDKMESVCKLSVPLKVDIGVGNNWLEAHG
ncbi:DNA polymerase I [bacterium]|nr:DNA polymerase I [bacterium]